MLASLFEFVSLGLIESLANYSGLEFTGARGLLVRTESIYVLETLAAPATFVFGQSMLTIQMFPSFKN